MNEAIEDLLRNVPLFADCRAPELARAASVMREVSVAPGDVLVLGPTTDTLYVVAAGTAEAAGLAVRTLARGDSFGEELLLGDPGIPITVRAITALHLLAMDGRALLMLLDSSPVAARSMLRGLLRRTRVAPASASVPSAPSA